MEQEEEEEGISSTQLMSTHLLCVRHSDVVVIIIICVCVCTGSFSSCGLSESW